MAFRDDVISGTKWSSIRTIFLAVAALLKISVLTRLLDKSDFGLMAMVTFVMGFMALFNDMGLTSAIIHKQNISKQEYASLYWLNLMVSGIMYIILVSLTPLISSFYGEVELKVLIPLLGLNLIISGIGRMFNTIEQKELSFKVISLFDIFSALMSLGLAIILAVNNYGVYSLVYSALLQYSLMNILYFILGIKKYGLSFHYKFKETRPFLKIGVYQVGGQIVNYFNKDIDILIVGKLFSAELLGGYSLAKELAMRPTQVFNPIILKVGAPALAKFQNSKQLLRENYLKIVNVIASINIPGYILLIIFAPQIIYLFYGAGYSNIIIPVRIFSVYMLIRSVNSPVGSLITATGRTKLEFYWNLMVLLITPLFVLVGSQFSLIGAALGMMCSMLFLIIPSWKFLINRLIGVSLKNYIKAFIPFNFYFKNNSLFHKDS